MTKHKKNRHSDSNPPTPPTPRNLALEALLRFQQDDQPIQDSLEDLFQQHHLEPRDRRQTAELAYGATRQLITLDHLIAKNTNRKLRRIEPPILNILRLGLYELLFSEGTPDFAAVSQAATNAKRSSGRPAAGFVNAVLRSIQRSLVGPIAPGDPAPLRRTLWTDAHRAWLFNTDVWPDPNTNPAKHLAAAWALPPWLLERWLKRYGLERTRLICHAQNLRPTLWLRANPNRLTGPQLADRLSQAGLQATAHDQAVELADHPHPEDLPGFSEGDFSVQDAAAQHAVSLVQPAPGERILDLCAAPGTKASALAELLGPQGLLIATDISPDRLQRLEQNRLRLNLQNLEIRPIQDPGQDFDAILLDVPCSNTGVLARRVEARHRLRPNDIAILRRTQRELLHRAANLLKPAGRIVYSTCSIEPAENELQIDRFLQDHHDFTCPRQDLVLPGGQALGDLPPSLQTHLEVQIPGQRHDASFAALLLRNP